MRREPTPLAGATANFRSRQAGESSGPLNVQDRLSATLEDIFHKKVVTDPLLKALLEKHGDVDLKELASELNEFSNGLGANKRKE